MSRYFQCLLCEVFDVSTNPFSAGLFSHLVCSLDERYPVICVTSRPHFSNTINHITMWACRLPSESYSGRNVLWDFTWLSWLERLFACGCSWMARTTAKTLGFVWRRKMIGSCMDVRGGEWDCFLLSWDYSPVFWNMWVDRVEERGCVRCQGRGQKFRVQILFEGSTSSWLLQTVIHRTLLVCLGLAGVNFDAICFTSCFSSVYGISWSSACKSVWWQFCVGNDTSAEHSPS